GFGLFSLRGCGLGLGSGFGLFGFGRCRLGRGLRLFGLRFAFFGGGFLGGHDAYSLSVFLSIFFSVSRRSTMSPTFLPRLAATARGDFMPSSASKVALSMLCGLEVPTDLATTSCTPRASNTARIGPPAMMPVPTGAVRMMTLPAPKRPYRSWCRVRPSRRGMRTMDFLAESRALRMASDTSFALPEP